MPMVASGASAADPWRRCLPPCGTQWQDRLSGWLTARQLLPGTGQGEAVPVPRLTGAIRASDRVSRRRNAASGCAETRRVGQFDSAKARRLFAACNRLPAAHQGGLPTATSRAAFAPGPDFPPRRGKMATASWCAKEPHGPIRGLFAPPPIQVVFATREKPPPRWNLGARQGPIRHPRECEKSGLTPVLRRPRPIRTGPGAASAAGVWRRLANYSVPKHNGLVRGRWFRSQRAPRRKTVGRVRRRLRLSQTEVAGLHPPAVV
jgi:hypothetical protein